MQNFQQILQAIQANSIKAIEVSKIFTLTDTGPQCVSTFHCRRSVSVLAVLSDGRLAAGGLCGEDADDADDVGIIELWDIQTNECIDLRGKSSVVCALAGSPLAVFPDGRLASVSEHKVIKLWDTQTRQCVSTFFCCDWPHSVCALAVLPDGRLASGSTDKTIKLWDTQTSQCVSTLRGHSNIVRALAVLPDGRLASGSDDKTIKLWDTQTGQCVSTLRGHSGGVGILTVLPDGRLAAVSENEIKLWDTQTGQCVFNFLDRPNTIVRALAVFPGGRLASVNNDKAITLWDTQRGKYVSTLGDSCFNALAVLPDGRLASRSTNGTTITLWQIERHLNTLEFNQLLTALVPNQSVKTLNLRGFDLTGVEDSLVQFLRSRKEIQLIPSMQMLPAITRIMMGANGSPSVQDILSLSTVDLRQLFVRTPVTEKSIQILQNTIAQLSEKPQRKNDIYTEFAAYTVNELKQLERYIQVVKVNGETFYKLNNHYQLLSISEYSCWQRTVQTYVEQNAAGQQQKIQFLQQELQRQQNELQQISAIRKQLLNTYFPQNDVARQKAMAGNDKRFEQEVKRVYHLHEKGVQEAKEAKEAASKAAEREWRERREREEGERSRRMLETPGETAKREEEEERKKQEERAREAEAQEERMREAREAAAQERMARETPEEKEKRESEEFEQHAIEKYDRYTRELPEIPSPRTSEERAEWAAWYYSKEKKEEREQQDRASSHRCVIQ